MQHVRDAVAATNRPSRAVARVDPSVTRYQEDIDKGVVMTVILKCGIIRVQSTGGLPLTQKSLTRFILPRFLAYVHVSGGFWR